MIYNKLYSIFALGILFTITSCNSCSKSGNSLAEGASRDMEEYESGDVNAIEQARPTIMVIPGDITLKQFGCLNNKIVDGSHYTERDYASYLQKDDRIRNIVSFIQNKFNEKNYPLNDFEQTLKDLDTQHSTDIADDLGQDAKTQLLLTAHPDIILQLDYRKKPNLTSHNYTDKTVSYTLSAIDAYTEKVVATITASNLMGTSTTEIIQKDLEEQMPKLMQDIQKYYSDLLKRGRDITVRINTKAESNIMLTDESIEGDTYSDWIIDYMKAHTVKGAYKMTRNTANELYFQNCRIKLLNSDGTQYSAYDFARDLQKNLHKNLGLTSTNNSQGLGEVVLTVNGMK